ncbi:conjugal transfer protein TraC [Candidatus Peregrinibacteria bacterium CG10_big_fil_rev_8_21_14_0_10_49_16]|nr:MAG: conjugal transfer protein TraC [Candidatus Peregrinibacteria bacterium CG10_big_fil_rev_8_21_14_0_10_49_16]
MAKKPETPPPQKSIPAPEQKAQQKSSLLDGLLGLEAKTSGKAQEGEAPLTKEEKEALKHYDEGIQKMLDLIAPAAMKVNTKSIILNDEYVRTFYVYNWPNFIYPNWLSQLVNFDAKFEMAHFIYPSDNKAIMRMLRKKVTEIRSSIRMLEQRGIVRDPTLEAALQDAEELRDLLARGQEKLFQFGMYVTIYAEDELHLKKLQTDIESILGGKLVLTKPAMFQMEHGWTSTLPLCLDELEIGRNMNTESVSTSFPFSSSDFTQDRGILYGINRHNDSLVIFDRFTLPNANSNIFATSGAGKSFTAKMEMLRYLMLGIEILVIDPENEYTNLCEAVGGSFIPLSIQSPFRINPFDLPQAIRGEEAAAGETLRASVINLHGLFKLMLGTLSPTEDGILDKAILDTYALRNITFETESPGEIPPPTMHDLVDVLMTTEGGEDMAKTLQKYTEGSFAGLFDKETNVELDNKMIVFQIRDLEEQLRPIAIYIALNFLWNRIRSEFKQRLLVIDEAWNLMQYEDSARFLYGIVKRARKYYLGITTITQDVDDFVESPYGRPIITNSSLQILMKQSPATVDSLQKLFYLTDGEKYLLVNSDVGQGILFAGYKHVAIQMIAGPEETALITTKPQEVAAQAAKKEEEAAALATPDIQEELPASEDVAQSEESIPEVEAPPEEERT